MVDYFVNKLRFLVFCNLFISMKNPRILVVITGYNWASYIDECLKSVSSQTYKNFIVSIVDDGSTDDSVSKLMTESDHIFRSNPVNLGTYYARDRAIKEITANSYDVIALLDGDDRLMVNALEKVAEQYEQGKFMTYGNWQNQNGERCGIDIHYSDEIHALRNYRSDIFRCTHLRTFKKELYFAIPAWELTSSEIKSFPDVELLFSMMEMCGKDRIGIIDDPIYTYDQFNPISTLKRFGKDDLGYQEITKRPRRELL